MDTTARHIGERPGKAGAAAPAAALPDFAKGPVIAATLVLAVLLIAFSGVMAITATSCTSWRVGATTPFTSCG